MKKKIKSYQGISLVALVITIIVLLILVGISLSAVFSQDGIFNRAEKTTSKYTESSARETLEMALGEAQMQKYEEGLTDEQLSNKINEIGEELNEEKTQVVVSGYIFEIDRNVPKVINCIGIANEIIITATLSNNETDGWIKPSESEAKITGTIKTFSGGIITNVSATKDGTPITEFTIDENGKYEIRVQESGIYKITAEDSKDKKKEKVLEAEVKVDNIKPTVDSVTAIAEGKKIKLSATGTDNESGIDYFNYTVAQRGATPSTGTFKKNQTVEINVTSWIEYTISVTAIDKCENVSETSVEEKVDMTDTTAPTLNSITANTEGWAIKLSAMATDDRSGIKEFNYTINPTDGLSKSSGTFKESETVTIKSTQEKTYTVSITVTDNNNNISSAKTSKVAINTTISISNAIQQINENNISNYIGAKVTNYKPKAGGTWRVFYYSADGRYTSTNKPTLFLKRDYVSDDTTLSGYSSYSTTNELNILSIMNPRFMNGVALLGSSGKDRCSLWLCDSSQWTDYCDSNYAIKAVGSPSIELFIDAYKTYYPNVSLSCEKRNFNGYTGYGLKVNGLQSASTGTDSISSGAGNVFIPEGTGSYWLASPHYLKSNNLIIVTGQTKEITYDTYSTKHGICPIAVIQK